MKVSDVIACLSAIAPPEYADESDPIGLQLGSSDSAVRTVILCVTADEQAVELARRRRAELIITHHPVIYNPLDSLADETYPASLLSVLVRLGVAVFSAHTNLDVAPGGVNDALAERACVCERLNR